MKKLIVKMCGICSQKDAYFCEQAKVDWLGFIFHPASPRYITAAEAAQISTSYVKRIGVFGPESGADEIIKTMDTAGLHMAQLHGGQDIDCCLKIGPEKVIKVFWPQRYHSTGDLLSNLDEFSQSVSYFLLDAGTDGGGHGRILSLNWDIMAECTRPWILAGGLNANNISSFNFKSIGSPAVLDFNSGVESSPGVKDAEKINQVINILKKHVS